LKAKKELIMRQPKRKRPANATSLRVVKIKNKQSEQIKGVQLTYHSSSGLCLAFLVNR
jgi:hypothetical protein